MNSYYLGLDAGGSKTVAVIADLNGLIVGRGRANTAGAVQATSANGRAVDEVLSAVNAALAQAGLHPRDIAHAAFRIAGVDWPDDESYWSGVLETHMATLQGMSVKNDGFALIRCGWASGIGIAISAGTGPQVVARGEDGGEYCAGWWVPQELGGQGLGDAAFSAVVDAEAGLGEKTALTTEILALFGCSNVTALLHTFTRRVDPRPPGDKRAAARTVLRVAGEGDPVAREIIAGQAHLFAGSAKIAANRTGLGSDGKPVPVVLGGSVLTSEHHIYRDALVESLRAQLGPIIVSPNPVTPVVGATLDAMVEGGVFVDTATYERLVSASHPVDFLLT